MTNERIFISQANTETRVALAHDDQIVEYYIERDKNKRLLGTVFLGVVKRILPGINSAFIDIGLEKSGFLFGADLIDSTIPAEKYPSVSIAERHSKVSLNQKPVDKILRSGQRVLVQVMKEALGSKGPRLTMAISLPGRYLVLMPNFKKVGVSRRIKCGEERARLKSLIEDFVPKGAGIVVRTAAVGITKSDILHDLNEIVATWHSLSSTISDLPAPSLALQDLGIAKKVVRDLLGPQTTEIIVDSSSLHFEISDFLEHLNHPNQVNVTLHPGGHSLFKDRGFENQIEKVFDTNIPLKSGGHLIVEEAEALCSFDVNTGSFVGTSRARQTILQTNLEAAKKIAEQIRLRNIGGIIVIDFIDMDHNDDRSLVLDHFREQLKHDKAKTNVLEFSQIGLVQLTRKRTSESLMKQMTSLCSACHGRGRVKSMETQTFDLLRQLQQLQKEISGKTLIVRIDEEMSLWIELNRDLLGSTILYSSEVNIRTYTNLPSTRRLSDRKFSVEFEEND